MSVDTLLNLLDGVKKTKADQWLAKCPSHDDKRASMVVTDDNGKTLVHCFAGCSAGDILHSVGLEFKDLFPETLDFKDRKIKGKPGLPRIPYRDLVTLMQSRITYLRIAMHQLVRGKKLPQNEMLEVAKMFDELTAIEQHCPEFSFNSNEQKHSLERGKAWCKQAANG